MFNDNITFERLMNSEKYWNSVSDEDLGVVLSENLTEPENEDWDLYDFHIIIEEGLLEEKEILADLAVHQEKRTNRKYMAARKHLIKDKRYLYRKANPRYWISKENKFTSLLFDRDILEIDNIHSVEYSRFNSDYISTENLRKKFYGKPIVGNKWCENIFVGNILKEEDSWWAYFLEDCENNRRRKYANLILKESLDLLNYDEDYFREDEDFVDPNFAPYVKYYEEPEQYWMTDLDVPDLIFQEGYIDYDYVDYGYYDEDWLYDEE